MRNHFGQKDTAAGKTDGVDLKIPLRAADSGSGDLTDADAPHSAVKRTRCSALRSCKMLRTFQWNRHRKSLRKSLSDIDGVGRVRVMLTVASGIQRVYQSDRRSLQRSGPVRRRTIPALRRLYCWTAAAAETKRCRRRSSTRLMGGAGGMRRRWQFRYSAESKRGCVCADRA